MSKPKIEDVERKEVNTKEDPPEDVYGIVYILFYLLGLVYILPWTFFVTAHDYWMYKFRNTTLEDDDPNYKTTLQTQFSPSLTITLQLSSIAFLFLCLFFGHRFSLKLKLFGPLLTSLTCMILAAAFILVDTDSWQMGFFALTMFIVAVINATSAVFGLANYSLISNFPEEYLAPYINGQGVATIFTAVLQICSLAVGISVDSSALVYFWVAIGVIAFTLILLILVLRFNNFYRHHVHSYVEKSGRTLKFGEIIHLMKVTWVAPAMMLFYLLVIEAVHPSITSLVVSEGAGSGEWSDVYFLPVTTFLIYAVLDFVGRVAAYKINYSLNPAWLVVVAALRALVFIPLILLCNAHPRHHLPVVFPHDYQYIIIMVAFSLSSGYSYGMNVHIIPKLVQPEQIEDAFHVFTVSSGVSLGVLSFLSFVSVDFL